ncbi:hypothetical protein ANCCAN_15920 [Ancylostoma caninum]|uniref:Uncharacterized protein n=1 Tax=Ancylostoma caninum TaxID=29170 RepID=A0A368G570_ANCCA|nr:hypothetical protein ANCCAN_15920 [Ancylostoma caninum]
MLTLKKSFNVSVTESVRHPLAFSLTENPNVVMKDGVPYVDRLHKRYNVSETVHKLPDEVVAIESAVKPRKKPENLASSQGPSTSQDKNERGNEDEPEKKKRKIPKRPELMYLRDPKKKKEEQAPNMKQRGRGPY